MHRRPQKHNAERSRAAMVAQLRQRGIDDERVLAAMAAVPRERFVAGDLADDTYADLPMWPSGRARRSPHRGSWRSAPPP